MAIDVFRYDSINRVTNMVDGVGTTKYTYSPAGQLLTEDGPWANDTVTNIYWNRLRMEMDLQQPSGVWTNEFTYDLAKRLHSVTSRAGEFDYQYQDSLPSTLVQKLSLPNTSYITNVFDGNARMLGTYLNNSSDVTLDSAVYGYNTGNQRTAAGLTNASSSLFNYTYDRIGQLKVANSTTASEKRGYSYDAAWNMTHRTNNGAVNEAFTLNNLNEITSESGSYNDYYDGNGNLTQHLASGGYNNGYMFIYDAENRLVQVAIYSSGSNIGQVNFQYDGLGRLRIRQSVDYNHYVTQTDYIYDGMRVIQERDINNVPQVSYTRGIDLSGSMEGAGGIGGMLARSTGYGSGWNSHAYYHSDGNGNVTYLVNGSQGLAASYRYDAFGNTLSSSGSLASANVYQFSSKESVLIDLYGGVDHLYYYGYRFYWANLQRWVNRDPLGEIGFRIIAPAARAINLVPSREAANNFNYVGNSPISDIDPYGLSLWGYLKCLASCKSDRILDDLNCLKWGAGYFVCSSVACAAICRAYPPACIPCMTVSVGGTIGYTYICGFQSLLKEEMCKARCQTSNL